MSHKEEISSVLTVNVRPDKIQAYEHWLESIKEVLESQAGFLGIEALRPSSAGKTEYLMFIRFAQKELLDRWRNSERFAELRRESEEFVLTVARDEQQFGTEMFFSRPVSNVYYPKPPFWKQICIGVLTVYPVILLASALIRPMMKGFHPMLATFLMVCLVSPSMIFLMPRVSKLFGFWLYPKAQ